MATLTVATFDPRFSIYDNADTLERWFVERGGRIKAARSVQQVHLDRLAAEKQQARNLRHRCLDCGLFLAESSLAKRCVTCHAQRRLAQQRDRRRATAAAGAR